MRSKENLFCLLNKKQYVYAHTLCLSVSICLSVSFFPSLSKILLNQGEQTLGTHFFVGNAEDSGRTDTQVCFLI